jgi:hypothetical protein
VSTDPLADATIRLAVDEPTDDDMRLIYGTTNPTAEQAWKGWRRLVRDGYLPADYLS